MMYQGYDMSICAITLPVRKLMHILQYEAFVTHVSACQCFIGRVTIIIKCFKYEAANTQL